MGKRGLITNVTLVAVVAVILFIISLTYSNVEVGAYVLLEDMETEVLNADELYNHKVLLGSIELDAYGVRLGDPIYYEEFNEIYVVLVASQAEDDMYNVRVYDFETNHTFPVIRTGLKNKLYHTYENLYWYVEEGYHGTYVLEISKGTEVIERMKIRTN